MVRWLKRREIIHVLICLGFLLLWGFLKYYSFDFLPKSELSTIADRVRYGRGAPVDPDLVFLTIDTASVSLSQLDDRVIAASRPLSLMRAGYPFSREVYADACDRLISAGAKVVTLDILFLSPKPEDVLWKEVLDHNRDHVVIGMNFSDEQLNGYSTTLTLPASDLFPDQDAFDNRLAYLNFWKNPYGVVTDAQYRQNLEYLNHKIPGSDKLPKYYSLAARTVQKAGFNNLVPDDLDSRALRFAGKPETKFPSYSLYTIFDPDSWNKTFHHGDFFRGKIVLIGPQGDWTKDELETPWGLMNGAEIHLNAINSLLQNEFLYPASDRLNITSALGAGLIALLLALAIPQIAWRFPAAVTLLGAYGAVLMWAYNGPGWLLPAVAPIGIFSATAGAGFVYDFVLAQVEKFRLRTTFERYNSKNVVQYLLDHTDSYREMLAGTRRPVTVLFSDIRGFTTMTEEADSQKLVEKLNEYFTAMVDCVFRHDGSLDKFMGDGIMAVWGNTPYNFGPKEDAIRAVRASLAMLTELRVLNTKWLAEGRGEWQIGIGLNHGQVIVGDMGSQQHKEFAVIGDAVNLGSRIEGLTKEYHVQILLGESVAELVRDQFHLRTVDLVQVKGKTKAVQTFTVLGEKSESQSPDFEEFLRLYEEAVALFRQREFARARDLFTQALQLRPDDFLASDYLADCEELAKNPPDAGWTGVRIMTKK
ncbi:MAG: CHASE2 domain-containing protein [Methylacidiphilales bacterium]|nr:CHASE2 domain-containing protein [Candidatus Methylacidiphilales bacterium]